MPLTRSRVQPLLVSRFLINLRQADDRTNYMSTKLETVPVSATVHFRTPTDTDTIGSVIGQMGRPLDFEPVTTWQDDDLEDESDDTGVAASSEPITHGETSQVV